MLQIVLFVCALVLIVWAPIECRKVRNGWKNARYKGTAEEYRRTYRKQINFVKWAALAAGVLNIGLAFIDEPDKAHFAVQLMLGGLWIVAGGVMFYCVHLLDTMPATPPSA